MESWRLSAMGLQILLFLLVAVKAGAKTVPGVSFEVDYVVAQDGSGDFLTIQSAIDGTPQNDRKSQAFIILVMPGVYHEQVQILKDHKYITMVGFPGKTIITNSKFAFSPNPDYTGVPYPPFNSGDPLQSLSSNDTGLNKPYLGTARSGTFIVKANGFIGVGLTFVNTFGPNSQDHPFAMAPAFRGYAWWLQMHYCTFLGFQDTLYAHRGIQLYRNCYISGSVDFIFGYARAWFDKCTIAVKGPPGYPGSIVAQARQTSDNFTGFVIKDSYIKGYGKMNLGRAWRNYSTVLYANNYMEDVITPGGWNDFGFMYRQGTVKFYEFNNTGPGANRSGRENFSRAISPTEAAYFLNPRYIKLQNWFRQPPPLIGNFSLPTIDVFANTTLPLHPVPAPGPQADGPGMAPEGAPREWFGVVPAPMSGAMEDRVLMDTGEFDDDDTSGAGLKKVSVALLLGLVLSVLAVS